MIKQLLYSFHQLFCQSIDCLCFSIFTLTVPTKNIKNEAKNSTQSHDLNLLQIPVTYRLNFFSRPSLRQGKYARIQHHWKRLFHDAYFTCLSVLSQFACMFCVLLGVSMSVLCITCFICFILCYQELRSSLNTECFLMCHMHPHNTCNNNLQKNSGHFVCNTCHTLPKLKTSVVINNQNMT